MLLKRWMLISLALENLSGLVLADGILMFAVPLPVLYAVCIVFRDTIRKTVKEELDRSHKRKQGSTSDAQQKGSHLYPAPGLVSEGVVDLEPRPANPLGAWEIHRVRQELDHRLNQRGVDAALFDWSGTLVDDLDIVWRAGDVAMTSFGIPHQNIDAFRKRYIMPWLPSYGLYGLGTPEKLKEVDTRFWSTYHGIPEDAQPFPHALRLLRSLKVAGIRTVIVTQMKRKPLLEQIRGLGFRDLVDATVAEEDSDELKPSPKPVLTALSKLGAILSRSVFIGDLAQDALSGSRAGARVISIVHRRGNHTEEMVRVENPNAPAHCLIEVGKMIQSL